MSGLEPLGRALLVIGVVLAIAGIVVLLAPRLPFLGRLPGDIRIERDGVTIFIPLGTMLVVSVVVSILLNLFGRGR
jgi:hypothetical protein